MTNWTTPITNRTAADVAQKTKKGVLNAADFNRIEGNTHHLAAVLAIEGLAPSPAWRAGDLVFAADIARILAGAKKVRAAGLLASPPALPGWMPETPAALSGYENVNDVEAIQLRARRGVDGNRDDFARTGEAVLGGRTGVI